MSVTTLKSFAELPRLNGILWQVLLNNVPLRRPWDSIGVGKTLIQWIAVDGYAFVDNPWLPTYNIKLDMDDLAAHPFASEIILGTPGFFSEVTSRNSLPLMADLAAKFATLDWPENVKGFYFPVEIDPTWHDAKAKLGPIWDLLPRPLYISAYYGEGIDGEEAAAWLADLLPPDVNLLFQDGVGAFGFTTQLALERLAQLDKHLGAHRVQMIAEVFTYNPNWGGVDGAYYTTLTPEEYRRRIGAYAELYQQGRLWAFDGPNYIPNALIDNLQGRPTLPVPTDLAARLDFEGDIRLYATTSQEGPEHGRKYTVYDSSGNKVLREYFSYPGEAFARYPRAHCLEDYGFAPSFVVFDVMSIRNPRYSSDRSKLFAGEVVLDEGIVVSTVSQSSWGDVAFKTTPVEADPSRFLYYFDIYHPTDRERVMRTLVVDGATASGGVIRADYANELNVPDSIAAFGGFAAPWNYLKWDLRYRPKTSSSAPERIGIYESANPVDNTSFVKKTVVMGINSLIGGYFNDLSDPSNEGGTGVPGRKDLVAAHTFRETFAARAGLCPIEVMPVMTVVGSSPINPMPYQQGFDLQNYWWDAANNAPGPNLLYADGIVRELKVTPHFFIESGPGETTGLAYAPAEQRPAILAAWRSSNIAMLAWMRANWGNPGLEIWFQSATTSWWGEGVPVDVNAECTKLVRDLQQSMALEGIGFKFGSYVPGSNKYTAYRDEMATGMGWVHYTGDVYHAASADMADAMATDTNRALNPPAWTTLGIVTGFQAQQRSNRDIRCSWQARAGATAWRYRNKRADTKAVIAEGVVTSPEFTFTRAQQEAVYGGNTASYIVCEVSEYIAATDDAGPPVEFNVATVPVGGLLQPTGLAARLESNGDVTQSWAARAGVSAWYFRNLRADNLAVITEGVLTAPANVFTAEQQRATYGYTAQYMVFEVQEYDPGSGETGPPAQFNAMAT